MLLALVRQLRPAQSIMAVDTKSIMTVDTQSIMAVDTRTPS